MLEKELYPLIKKNFGKRYNLYYEIRLYSRIIDILLLDKKNSEQIIAMEFKLKDWEKALIQAFTYLLIANYVYIVLYYKYIDSVNKDLLRTNGIGLISASKSGYKIIVKPKKNENLDKTLLMKVKNDLKIRDMKNGKF